MTRPIALPYTTFLPSLPNIEVRPSVEEVQKMLIQVAGGDLHFTTVPMQAGQTIQSVNKGVAQWAGTSKLRTAVQAVVQEGKGQVGQILQIYTQFCTK